MPNLYFISFEILELILFLFCLRHAWRTGSAAIGQLLAGIIFGILLELTSMAVTQYYHYGQFTVMVLAVPLAIGVAWGNQLYAVRLISNATNLPGWARPILDALLIIFVDLIVDPIAIRLGMWSWRIGLQEQFFGVPYVNFWGFFWLVYSFSITLRSIASLRGWAGKWLAPPAAILAGLFVMRTMIGLMGYWLPADVGIFLVAVVPVIAPALILALRPRLVQPPPALAWQYLLLTQGYILIAGLFSGVIFRPPILSGMSLLMLFITFYFYRRAGLWRPAVESY
jgi:hypothetical protein